MTERPILMSAPMVRAILDGRKTQTRRAVKPQPTGEPRPLDEWSRGLASACHDHNPDEGKVASHVAKLRGRVFPFTTEHGTLMSPVCPYGVPGDRLWVRETTAIWPGQGLVYTADDDAAHYELKKRPAIFMSRVACRLVLEVTAVRVERLQEISAEDVLAEGINDRWSCGNEAWTADQCDEARLEYRALWDSLNAKRGFWWDVNPWCWAITFRRVT